MSSSADSSFRLPIFIDTMTFDDRHEKLFRDFHRQMDTDFSRMRRREFDSDFDRMTRDFYHLRPRSAGSCGGGSSVGGGGSRQRLREDFGSKESLDEDTTSRLIIDNASGGPRKFQISFDVKEYRPDDISVKVKENTLVLEAKHEEIADGSRRSKEFSRTVRLPRDVDVERLTSTLSKDGVLTVQAPMPPKYGGIVISDNNFSSAPVSPKSYASTVDKCQLSPSFSEASAYTGFNQSTSDINSELAGQFPTYVSLPSGGRKLELLVEVSKSFCSEDIVVRVDGTKMIIECRREMEYNEQKCRINFNREYDLNCELVSSTIEATLNSNGKLRVTALLA